MSIPLSKRFSARMSAIGTLPKPAPLEATDIEGTEVVTAKPARFSFKTSHHARLPEVEKPNSYMADLEAHDVEPRN